MTIFILSPLFDGYRQCYVRYGGRLYYLTIVLTNDGPLHDRVFSSTRPAADIVINRRAPCSSPRAAADVVTNRWASGSLLYSKAFSNTTTLRTVIQQRTL